MYATGNPREALRCSSDSSQDLGTRPTSFTCRGPGLESARTGGKKEQQGMALLDGGPKSPFWGWDQLSMEAAYKTSILKSEGQA